MERERAAAVDRVSRSRAIPRTAARLTMVAAANWIAVPAAIRCLAAWTTFAFAPPTRAPKLPRCAPALGQNPPWMPSVPSKADAQPSIAVRQWQETRLLRPAFFRGRRSNRAPTRRHGSTCGVALPRNSEAPRRLRIADAFGLARGDARRGTGNEVQISHDGGGERKRRIHYV